MDPWRIAPEDRQKYEAQFRSLGPAGGHVTGAQARGHFLQSGLPSTELAKIWHLADYDADGRMSLPEFCAACFLIRRRLQGCPVPDALPPSLLQLPPASSAAAPATAFSSAAPPQHHQQQQHQQPQQSMAGAATASEDWAVPSNVRAKYKLRFNQEDRMRKGHLTGLEARTCLMQSGLGQQVLAQIWGLADVDRDGRLGPDEFVLAMHFVDVCMAGRQLPHALPPEMVPPSFRHQGQQQPASAAAAASSMMLPARPASAAAVEGPPQAQRRSSQDVSGSGEVFRQTSTLEEKRRENFQRGQAELEKRKEALRDQMRAIEEARLAKERALQEQQEAARQAKERARQQELERQREAQRAVEAEREAARRKAAEERERARMESERARMEAVEQQRAAAASQRLQAEQDQLAEAEQREANWREELDNLAEKGRECQQRADKHRSEIDLHKADIEAMRQRRDQLLADITDRQTALETKRSAVEALQRAKEELSLKLLQSDPLEEQRKTLEANISAKKAAVSEAKARSVEAESALTRRGEELANTRNRIVRTRAEADRIRAEIGKVKARLQQKMQQQQQQQPPVSAAFGKPTTTATSKTSAPPATSLFDNSDDFFSSTSAWPPPTAATATATTATAGPAAAEENGFGDLDWGQAAMPTTTTATAVATSSASHDLGDIFGQQPSQSQQQKKPPVEDEFEAVKSTQDKRNWAAFSAAFDALKPTTTTQASSSATSTAAPTAAASEPVYDEIHAPYRVLYDFAASRHDELSVHVGDFVTVSAGDQAEVEASWVFVRCGGSSGASGLVPRNYVAEEGTAEAEAAAAAAASQYDFLPPSSGADAATGTATAAAPRSSASSSAAASAAASAASAAFPGGGHNESASAFSKVTKLAAPYAAVAVAAHQAASPSELSLTIGREVSVSMRKDNWLFGRAADAASGGGGCVSEGWFPVACVEQSDYVNVPTSSSSGGAGPHNSKVVVSLYQFDSGTPGDLNFGVAEEIVVTSDHLGDWWEGHLRSDPSQRGIFPANFVADPATAAAAASGADATGAADAAGADADPFAEAAPAAVADPFADAGGSGSNGTGAFDAFSSSAFDDQQQQQQQQQQEIAIATAPFDAGGEGQLSLRVGTRILVKKKPPSGWWNGEVVENGVKRVGWFPASYTRLEQQSASASTGGGGSSVDLQQQQQQQSGRPASRQSVTSNQSMPPPTSAAPTAVGSASGGALPSSPLKKKTSISAGRSSAGTAAATAAASSAVSASTPNLAAGAAASGGGGGGGSSTMSAPACDIDGSQQPAERVVAKYRYQARNDDELTFEKGTIITVISKDEPEWHRGRTPSMREGLFPVNYVEPMPQQQQQQQQQQHQGPSRQMVMNELSNTENAYYLDLQEVWTKFHEPMLQSGLLTQDQLDAIFLNWVDLMNCSYSLLMALKVRKEGGTDAIGDILLQHLPQLTCYVRFCGRQSAATQLLTQRINSVPELAQLVRRCEQQTASGKLMGLIQYFVKPMQRITRYPLLIEKLLKATPEAHPDRTSLQEALDEARKLCQTVNESVRETENSGRLEWCQDHVLCEGLSEKLVFNSQTNCLGQRRLVHWGTLCKQKGGKELVVFLFNDFLLLTVPTFNTQGRPFVFPSLALDGNTASASAAAASNSSAAAGGGGGSSDQAASSASAAVATAAAQKQQQKYRMYKKPIILNDLMVVPESDSSEPVLCFRVLPNEDWLFRCQSAQDRDRWKDRLTKTAKEYHTATEILAVQENHQRSRAFSRESVGRLLLTVEQAASLKVGNLGGDNKSDPYAEVSLGSQRQCTEVIRATLNPVWNQAMQFHIADPNEDVLSITVYDKDFFSPNTFLGRAELRVADIAKELARVKHGPITKRVRLAEVDTGEVQLKLDLQLHGSA